jgi:chaperonin cofactor prefoldin
MARNHGTSGLDPSVSDRASAEIERFSEALEAAMVDPTTDALNELEEAADDLMRATGRVLIEVGRLRSTRKVHQ